MVQKGIENAQFVGLTVIDPCVKIRMTIAQAHQSSRKDDIPQVGPLIVLHIDETAACGNDLDRGCMSLGVRSSKQSMTANPISALPPKPLPFGLVKTPMRLSVSSTSRMSFIPCSPTAHRRRSRMFFPR